MSQIEAQYNEFTNLITQTISNVDVDLLIKIMYLERKLPDAPPMVELTIDYNPGTNIKNKSEAIRAKYGFPMNVGEHGLTLVNQMSVSLIEELSKDRDVKFISGKATPASY
ncbi:hypothetical protein AAA799E16_01633 [Marine Group I thaumarchaeote SCGC AAA799-E16]|uniref:Uncharacterized protein n=4 Tax=Marine Group I TaxID=905826 RepID=A0A087S745_9ARCH|nr:hypothetical protein AAA799E16_01633 [Marine Group I thaumarchaeote SCGC AAA799-E16]KFM16736.1 hypothetical protein AAA799D11_00547 [Marine Group I thaumarchaeote SCGC AAA799-D11]KFM18657.1 hypothetical protein SCCGRSA3_00990 [Marine Group I thaumarchaeote SCGC RSA3]KFM21549.1 hypothetical protein AAA799B03_00917 [Marine Group I thaumarchaeote SCGC AAA799-B03]